MEEYKDYTIEISLKSPIVTPFQSDTIFGHICWAIRFLQWGETDKLYDFLSTYKEEVPPPLLVSNGFPKGYLPKPVMPPITQKDLEKVIGRNNRIEDSFKVKMIKKMDIIPKEDFRQLQEGAITPQKLFEVMFECYEAIVDETNKLQSMLVQHNTIDRIRGRVARGGLYAQEEFFCDFNGEEKLKFEIYLKTYYFTFEDIHRIFDFIKEQGFGRDKSTGKGYFTFEIKEGIDLPESTPPNAFMTLSSYIPTEKDPTEGHYQILLKYGKLGGMYAKGVPEVKRSPFKKPLIMLSAGSTFYDHAYYLGKIYGSLMDGVHHSDEIRHYAYAFPIGINLDVPKGYE